MKRQMDFWLMWVGLLLVAVLFTPSLGQAKEEMGTRYPGMQWERLIKELDLAPDKAKEFQAVDDKYAQSRKEVVEKLKNCESDLEKALAASPPDEGKIKQLVATVIADHGKLFETFKAQRQEEMALLTPVQQGKFLLVLKKWHEEMAQKEKKE